VGLGERNFKDPLVSLGDSNIGSFTVEAAKLSLDERPSPPSSYFPIGVQLSPFLDMYTITFLFARN